MIHRYHTFSKSAGIIGFFSDQDESYSKRISHAQFGFLSLSIICRVINDLQANSIPFRSVQKIMCQIGKIICDEDVMDLKDLKIYVNRSRYPKI